MYETCKNTQIELQHFCSPKKAVPTVFARYNREQLGKYTGKLIVTTDPGIRVWYGMVVYQKDGKTCEGSPLSALHAYNQIISLLFSYYFPSCSLLFPYFSPIVPYCFYYLPIISVLVPYFRPIIYFPIYNFLILPYYCPICLPGFQNDKLRHLEWLCFDCHAKCLKPWHNLISHQNSRFHCFLMTFSQKTTIETQKWWPFQKTHFFVHPLATLSTVMLHVWNLQKHTNWIATLLQPQKSGSNCLCKI